MKVQYTLSQAEVTEAIRQWLTQTQGVRYYQMESTTFHAPDGELAQIEARIVCDTNKKSPVSERN